MNQDKMHLVNKIFNNETIRTVWDKEQEKYFISVVDIVGVISESDNPRNYWKVLKHRLKQEGNESVTNCNQLKLKASDGKYYNTDVVDIEGMFRIIESIPSKNAEPIKQWLAHLGSERVDEIFDPSIAAQRSIDLYRAKGYDEVWIAKRVKGIQDRKTLTDVWQAGNITEEKEFAILTNEIYKEWSGMSAKEYKQYKGLRKESLRDNMSDIEVALADLGEIATRELAKKLDYMTPNRLLEEIIVCFEFYQKLILVGNIHDAIICLDYLLTLASSMETLGFTIEDFVLYLGSMIEAKMEIRYKEAKGSGNSVKIMNIHKSKGLEFPICYFAGFHQGFNLRDLQSRFMVDSTYGILTPFYKEGIGTLFTKQLIKNKYLEEEIAESLTFIFAELYEAPSYKEICKIMNENIMDFVENVEEYIDDIQNHELYEQFVSYRNSIKKSEKENVNE